MRKSIDLYGRIFATIYLAIYPNNVTLPQLRNLTFGDNLLNVRRDRKDKQEMQNKILGENADCVFGVLARVSEQEKKRKWHNSFTGPQAVTLFPIFSAYSERDDQSLSLTKRNQVYI